MNHGYTLGSRIELKGPGQGFQHELRLPCYIVALVSVESY